MGLFTILSIQSGIQGQTVRITTSLIGIHISQRLYTPHYQVFSFQTHGFPNSGVPICTPYSL